MRTQIQNREEKLILKISKFGLNKVLLYSSKSQNFYGIIVTKEELFFLETGKFDQNVPIVLFKCLVLIQIALRLPSEPRWGRQYKFRGIYRTQWNIAAMKRFCKNSFKAFNCYLFWQKTRSQMFKQVLNTPLKLLKFTYVISIEKIHVSTGFHLVVFTHDNIPVLIRCIFLQWLVRSIKHYEIYF